MSLKKILKSTFSGVCFACADSWKWDKVSIAVSLCFENN